MLDDIIVNLKKELLEHIDNVYNEIKKKELERIFNTNDYTLNYGMRRIYTNDLKHILPQGHYIIKMICLISPDPLVYNSLNQTSKKYYVVDNYGNCFKVRFGNSKIELMSKPKSAEKFNFYKEECYNNTIPLPNMLIDMLNFNDSNSENILELYSDKPLSNIVQNFIKKIAEISKIYYEKFGKYDSLYQSGNLKQYDILLEELKNLQILTKKLSEENETIKNEKNKLEEILIYDIEKNNLKKQLEIIGKENRQIKNINKSFNDENIKLKEQLEKLTDQKNHLEKMNTKLAEKIIETNKQKLNTEYTLAQNLIKSNTTNTKSKSTNSNSITPNNKIITKLQNSCKISTNYKKILKNCTNSNLDLNSHNNLTKSIVKRVSWFDIDKQIESITNDKSITNNESITNDNYDSSNNSSYVHDYMNYEANLDKIPEKELFNKTHILPQSLSSNEISNTNNQIKKPIKKPIKNKFFNFRNKFIKLPGY